MIELLIICSLVFYTPYYDCSEQWTIQYHPNSIMVQSYGNNNWYVGFADVKDKSVHIGKIKTDKCGNSLLGHELNHLKYNDDSHNWYRNYGACGSGEFQNVDWGK